MEFDVSRCPACKQIVDVARQDFTYVVGEGKSGRVTNKPPSDPNAINVRVHANHADQFIRMVADGSWSAAEPAKTATVEKAGR